MKVPQKLIDRFHELQDRYYSAEREAREANERCRIAMMLRDECKMAIDAIEDAAEEQDEAGGFGPEILEALES